MATRTMDAVFARARPRSMRGAPGFYLSCLLLLLVSALVLTILVPAWLSSGAARSLAADGVSTIEPPSSTGSGSAVNSTFPPDAGAAQPTAVFPAFAPRGGGLYATGEAGAP